MITDINPFLLTDGYKVGHHKMYPKATTLVYTNFTPRSYKYAPKGCDKLIVFGSQLTIKVIYESFHNNFFNKPKGDVISEIKKEYSLYLGYDYDTSHIERLWDLKYLPIRVKSLPEGTKVGMGVPVLTIVNTHPDFFWITNFLETIISNLLWKPMTSATLAYFFNKDIIQKYAKLTDKNNEFTKFQAHDFSMRGMDSPFAVIASGLGHSLSFLGSDSLPVIYGARKYYNATEGVIHSVNATEHSIMSSNTANIKAIIEETGQYDGFVIDDYYGE